MPSVEKPTPGLGSITIVVVPNAFQPPLSDQQQALVKALFPKTWERGHWAKGRITEDIKEEMLNTARVEMPEAYKQIEALLAGIALEFRVKEGGAT